MKVINLFGGPGSGKSTSAAALFTFLKNKGVDAELVGEEARDQIYWGSHVQLENQFLLAAMQYARLKNLERNGCRVAISDSPLDMIKIYSENKPYNKELSALIDRISSDFLNVNVFVRRTKPFSTFGRIQKDIEEAKYFDKRVFDTFKFDYSITGDVYGQNLLCGFFAELK